MRQTTESVTGVPRTMEVQEPLIGSHPMSYKSPKHVNQDPQICQSSCGKEIAEHVQYGASLVATEGLRVHVPLHARDKVAETGKCGK